MNGATGDDGLVFDVLGALEVRGPGGVLDLGPRQRRLFLLRLLVAEQRPVPFDQLYEDLWAGNPPPGAASSVHAHVSRLRTVLRPDRDGPQPLVRDRAGYALLVPPAALTSHRFEAAVERSRHLLSWGRADAARAEIDRALRWWRGTAFADAAGRPFARAEATRLDEARLAGQELRIALLLVAGDATHAAAAARAMVAEHPLRESAWCLLIRSLYLCGRAAEAVQQYARIRAALVAELGTEPGPALRDLHVAVLRHDTAAIDLRPRRPAARAGTPALPVDGPPAPGLVGREREVAALHDVLRCAHDGRPAWAVVDGEGGSGKTALVERVAADARQSGWRVVFTRPVAAVGTAPPWSVAQLRQPLLDLAGDDLSGLADRPTLWVVEDLQWTGDAARAYLGELAVGLRDVPLAVVCTVRDADAPPVDALTLLLTRLGAARVPVRPLDARQVDHLLRARRPGTRARRAAGPGVSSDALALYERSGGNPFFLTALLGLPERQRFGPGAPVPPGALSMLRAKLRELPTPTRSLLRAAAGTGGRFDAGDVGVPPGELDEVLDAAVTAGLVRRLPVGGKRGGYRFAMTLVPEVLLQDGSPAR